ncbi:hypothetical protein LTR37_014634 [Vermiconidia calcicola]|uniref:Uncharacterized protein n=1 Tax=Vermiconidia calcicola TaxID=1690605 RepID=A0ACC3MT31_9PEZI|nr:hypothetical protein LTR37_014634 [Vermiconidia calcicola]
MALQRTLRLPQVLRPAVSRCTFVSKRHYPGSRTQDDKAPSVEGASGKDEKKAQPKILNKSPPESQDESQDVKDHNKDMDKRAERRTDKSNPEHAENDKVDKDFWSGSSKVGGASGNK